MNLKELRNKIKNITDYNPEIQTYLDDLDNLINDSYSEIYLSKRWTFAQHLCYLNIYPDITPTSEPSVTRNANVVDGRRNVAFSSAIPEFLEDRRHWEGQIFELQGMEYTILSIDPSGAALRVQEPLRCTSNVDDVSWRIKHRFYTMPEDLYDILSLSHRDAPVPSNLPIWGKKTGLPARREEDLDLRIDYTADFSEAYVPLPPWNIPSGMKLKLELTTQAEPPIATLPPGHYEFCWAFQKYGRIGPLSEPNTINALDGIQTAAVGITLRFLDWRDQPVAADAYDPSSDVYANNWEGYEKVIFYNSNIDPATGERRGLPCWRMCNDAAAIKTRDDHLPIQVDDETSFYEIKFAGEVDSGSPRYEEWDGQHHVIRPYPRPQGFEKEYLTVQAGPNDPALYHRQFRQYQLRYQRKPQKLCEVTDTPQMPYEFHQNIVYRCLHEIFIKGGNQGLAAMYDKKYQDSLRELEKRYVDRTDTFWQKGQFGLTDTNIQYDFNSLRKLN